MTDGLKNITISESAGYCDKLNEPHKVLNTTTQNSITTCQANIDFYSMQYSLLINVFVVGIGALFFFLTAIWIVKDKLRAENFHIAHFQSCIGCNQYDKIVQKLQKSLFVDIYFIFIINYCIPSTFGLSIKKDKFRNLHNF